MRIFLPFFILAILSFLAKANISGYGGEVAGEGPAGAAPAAAAPAAAPSPACDDSTSEAKANGPNPFCVYPALVGDHPSSGNRPGPTNSVDIPPGVDAFGAAASESAPAAPESAPSAPSAPASAPGASSSYSKSAARIRAFRRT